MPLPVGDKLGSHDGSRQRSGSTPSNSLERALRILEIIGQKRLGLTNKEVSQELGIATSSSSYILGRLENEGFVTRNVATGRYQIGLKVVAIARGALQLMSFRTVAEAIAQRLAGETGLEAVIGVLHEDKLMVVNRMPSGELQKSDIGTGFELPAHATAMGKALLAYQTEEEIETFLAKTELRQMTPKTITSRPELIAELKEVKRQGVSVCDGEHVVGLRSIAAPILDPDGVVRASLALVGRSDQPAWADLSSVVERVKAAGREISRQVRLQSFGR